MDFDYIVDHAIKNVWCTPRQDQQVIIKPARLTRRHGVRKQFQLMWRTVATPDQTSRWHIYQIGGTHPLAFNLFARNYSWVKISEACEAQSMLADLYSVNGYKIPLSDSYYAYSADHNLIIALKVSNKFGIDLNYEDIYLRVYSNAYFDSPRSTGLTDKIRVSGRLINGASDRNILRVSFDAWTAMPGATWLFINGVMYKSWDVNLMPIGSYAEVIHDGSVKKVLELPLADMEMFESRLDETLKYLLHYSGADDGTIDYQDDIDVYMSAEIGAGINKSLWYNKNNPNAMRNLTHRDYSIVSSYVKRYAEAFELMTVPRGFVDPLDMKATLYIRHSGYDRDLVFENSRIHELYKMQDLDVQRAMTGIDATVSVWQAANLEAAAYPQVMRSPCCDITNQMVEDAYGYNAISKILADTPSKPYDNNGTQGVDVPYKLQYGCTAYEYDADGLLTGFYQHYVGNFYAIKNAGTAYVELIAGLGSAFLDEYKGIQAMPLSDRYSYRVYECMSIGGIADNKWKDVTDSGKYVMSKTQFEWTDTSLTSYTMLRSDKRFLARNYALTIEDGLLEFTLQQKVSTGTGVQEQIMQVPMGQIDIFMNGRSLVKDLDYFVEFPRVFIVNKKYLKRPIASMTQDIHVRFVGFSSKDFELVSDGNAGFVEHGMLSNDSKFNLRDDKVLRIIVDGTLCTRDELVFSELTSGVNVTDPLNGVPYLVKDILVPVSSHTTSDTYELRQKAALIDKAVSEYLTLKIPQPPRPAPSAILLRHQLYSPFCNALIMDLINDRLRLPVQTSGYTRQQVLDICKPYEWLLKFDPSQSERAQDLRYVVIHPHGFDYVISLPEKSYQFVRQAIIYYTQDRVELSQLVMIA